MQFQEKPPVTTREKYDWESIAAELKAHPGEWGRVNEGREMVSRTAAQAVSRYMRSGRSPYLGHGEYEATTRGSDVWAKYVGPSN